MSKNSIRNTKRRLIELKPPENDGLTEKEAEELMRNAGARKLRRLRAEAERELTSQLTS